ncbi:MAG: TolC family outer membrane protein [Sulfuricurvum sp.]|nr:TolC family outer membrane protein [Sulfuricurvum sp.]
MRSIIAALLLGNSLMALTLNQAVHESLQTHPIIQERLNNFRATQQDLKIAEAEYYPSLDARAVVGYNHAGEQYSHVVSPDPEYTNYESSLTLTQNLFNGNGTRHKVDYQESRILAAAYNYVEKANDIAFQTVGAYLNVLRAKELLETARENVAINTDLFTKVKTLFDGGLTTKSEMNKINASLALARSNRTVQENNFRDTFATLRRFTGHEIDPAGLENPVLNAKMPESFERAAMIAIANNPSIVVGRYNIKGAQSLMNEGKKGYYPKLDLEINQFFNDAHHDNNGFDQPDDRFRARLVMNYNLYRGGADRAAEQRGVSKINQEVQTMLESKRQALEGIEFSWNAHEMIEKQLVDLLEYRKYAEVTLDLYKDEFDMGRRSMLDILAAQNDLIGSRQQIINAQYDALYARYRILDAMGLMVVAVMGSDAEYSSKVNIGNQKAEFVNDTLPVKLDQDNDTIPDNLDLCDNSKAGEKLMPYGCSKPKGLKFETPKAIAVPSPKVTPVLTPKHVAVIEADRDEDSVIDSNDQCSDTPKGYSVDKNGCPVQLTLHINFATYSDVIPKSSFAEIDELVKFMKANKYYTIDINGHTDSTGEVGPNQVLSEKRAISLRKVLIDSGISESRMLAKGYGEIQPIVSNMESGGRAQNRRTEVIMHANGGKK